MVKFKYTKINNKNKRYNDDNKYNNKDDNKYNRSILTSKNKNKLVLKGGTYYRKNKNNNSIYKNKRTKNILKTRTLDELNTYDSSLSKQSGGFIIKYLKFKYKLRKIKKIIEKLNKNEKVMNEFINSYKTQTNTIKRLTDKKSATIYEDIRTKKDKTIIEYLKKNKKELSNVKTSDVEHSLELIQTKEKITIPNEIKQFNKEIKKELPKFKLNQKKFNSDSKKFRKINKEFQELQAFYIEQAEILDKYRDLEGKTQLRKEDEKEKKKYTKYKADIDYILNFKQNNIDSINKQIQEIDTILDKSDTYKKEFEGLDKKQNDYKKILSDWNSNYTSIFKNIQTIDGNIGSIETIFKNIENIIEIIQRELSTIYVAIKTTDKLDPILKVKKILETNLKILNSTKTIINKIKFAFIQNIAYEKIEFDTVYCEAGIKYIQNQMKELRNSLKADENQLKLTGVTEKILGGGAKLKHNDFKDLTMKLFLDEKYDTIIETLTDINTNLNDKTSKIYKENKDFLDIMKTYFSIYLFFLYYYKTRSHSSTDLIITGDDDDDEPQITIDDTDKDIIRYFIKIIKIYEDIIKDTKLIKFTDLSTQKQDEIFKHTNENIKLQAFIINIDTMIKDYFNKINNDDIIYNPNLAKDETIKDLFYEYNPHSDDTDKTDNLGCIKIFIGYVDNKIITPIMKSNCKIDNTTIFDHTNNILYKNDVQDTLLLYDIDHDGKYKFYTVYFDKSINQLNTIKAKKISYYNEIERKYNDFKTFLNLATKLRGTAGNANIFYPNGKADTRHLTQPQIDKLIVDSNNNIKDEDIDTKFFCNDACNTEIISSIDKKIKANDVIQYVGNNYSSMPLNTPPPTNIEIKNLKNLFKDNTHNSWFNPSGIFYFPCIYAQNTDWLKKSIIAYVLISIYNNVAYNANIEGVGAAAATLNPSPTQKPVCIFKKPGEDKYIILYETPNDIIETSKKVKGTQTYLYIWLNSNLNKDPDTILKKDKFSNYIKKLYDPSLSSKKLNTLDINKINDFDIIKNIYRDDQTILIDEFKKLDSEINISKFKTYSTDKDIYKTDSTELKRPEDRYLFDNKKAYDDDTAYNNTNKSNFIASPIAKPLVKDSYLNPEKKDVKELIKTDSIKRIVSFNVHRWHRIDDKEKLRTDPNYAIHFIKEFLTETNVIGFLDYTLYPENSDSAKTHTSDFISGGSYINKQTKKNMNNITNNKTNNITNKKTNKNVKQYKQNKIQYGGVDSSFVNVSSNYTSDKMKDSLKLNNVVIINDNNNNAISTENIFLGKSIYSDSKLEKEKILSITNSKDTILYSEYTISKNKIGLYLINFTDADDKVIPPVKFTDKIKNLIKTITDNIVKNNGKLEIVLMGNFFYSPADDKDAFDMLDKKYRRLPSNFTNINGNTIDMCYVSKEFDETFIILNKDIIVKSGGISDHYPIYIDICEKNNIVGVSIDGTSVTSISISGSTSLLTNSEKLEAEALNAKRLLSMFLSDAKGMEDIIAKNKAVILDKISDIINKIDKELKLEVYTRITNNINDLSQNIIKLKLIEPKLTPDNFVIKEYSKKIKEFSWIADYANKESAKLNLVDETKELAKLIKDNPDIAKILPSKDANITSIEIQLINSSIIIKNNKIDKTDTTIQAIIDKLKNSENAKKMLEYIVSTLKTNDYERCKRIYILQSETNSTVFFQYTQDNNCSTIISDYEKKAKDDKRNKR